MPASTPPPPPWNHESHRREQIRRGLELSAEERLRWLETTMAEMRVLLGRATKKASDGQG